MALQLMHRGDPCVTIGHARLSFQVLNVSVLKGEQVTVEDTGGREPFILANESVLMRGLVLRSWSNQISIRFRSDQQRNSGFLLLHYQGEPVPEAQLYCQITQAVRQSNSFLSLVSHSLWVEESKKSHWHSGKTIQTSSSLL